MSNRRKTFFYVSMGVVIAVLGTVFFIFTATKAHAYTSYKPDVRLETDAEMEARCRAGGRGGGNEECERREVPDPDTCIEVPNAGSCFNTCTIPLS